jgi:hypothetical protein
MQPLASKRCKSRESGFRLDAFSETGLAALRALGNSSPIHRYLLMMLGKGLVGPNSRVYCQKPKGCLGVTLITIVGIIVVGSLWGVLVLAGVRIGKSPKDQWTWLDYGNFYIVATGIATVLIGFLVILKLRPPTDGVQALGFLTALFGAILGLVGTFFGVKQSADAVAALSSGAGTAAPTITLNPPAGIAAVNQPHEVTATVTSVDGSPASNVYVTFAVTHGPDSNTTNMVMTDEFGQASFNFNNNGNAGTDTIEATALGGNGTATVVFQ